MALTALLLNLGGNIFNMEDLRLEAHQGALRQLGFREALNRKSYAEFMVRSSQEVAAQIISLCNIQGTSCGDYLNMCEMHYTRLVQQKAEAHSGVVPLLDYARRLGIRRVIVSSQSSMEIERALKKIKLDRLVDAVVSVDDVEHPKPAADPYLLALRRAGTAHSPQQALALEDTDIGCESALAAGVRVVGVRHGLNDNHSLRGVVREVQKLEMMNHMGFLDMLRNL